jgi:glycosyltransferase involved in cell wall biosynthesis
MSQQNILFGVLSLDLGGLERLVLDLARVNVRRGNAVSIVCIEHDGRLADEAREIGAEVVSLNKGPGRSSQAMADARRLLAELQPDVVHTHQIGALWYLGRAARELGIESIVHTEHSNHVKQARSWRGKLRARYLWWSAGRLARRFCCVSDDVAAAVRQWGTVPRRRVSVVLNGIDTERYGDRSERPAVRRGLGIADDAVVIGTVGRLAEVKRQDLLVRAVAELRGKLPQATLLVVGDGPERERLEALAAELGVASAVKFAGYQSQPERFLAAMDVFALTSRHEALPLSLLEAWATGLPVVSSAVGGIPKVVEHERTGLLFESGDVAGLTASLARLLSDRELAAQLAAAGEREVRENYSLERMADEYERHYAAATGAVRQS